MKKIVLIALVLISPLGRGQYLYCQQIQTLSTDFIRLTTTNDIKESVSGILFYKAPSMIILKIENPVKQWIIYDKNMMTIYYPYEKSAFQIKFQHPISLPSFQAFMGSIKEDFGLSDLGYSLKEYEKKDNSLYSIWIPPKKAEKILGEFSIEYQDEKLIFSEIRDQKGKISSKSIYKNHIQYGFYFVPLEINTTYYSRSSSTVEVVKFSNPIFDSSLPKEITNFEIPKDTIIKIIEW